MRSRILVLVLVMCVGVLAWMHVRSSTHDLRAQLETLQQQRREMIGLESDRARLLKSIEAVDAATLHHASLLTTPAADKSVPAPPPFAVGEWTPHAAWSNTGQATPRDTVATALWAAAGGDALAMQSLLEIEPTARSKAEQVLGQLPPAARSSYVTPEALIANVTMKLIPLTQAQIAWYHERDDDHATVGVLFDTAEGSPEPVVKILAGQQDRSPPSLSDNRTSKLALLTMHRSSSGWRLVVPVSAVDRIAGELGLPKK